MKNRLEIESAIDFLQGHTDEQQPEKFPIDDKGLAILMDNDELGLNKGAVMLAVSVLKWVLKE